MTKLKYEILLEEKGLNLSDLPADAQRIIANIKKIKGGIALNEGKGKKPSDKNIADLNLQDKLAAREINEYLAEKGKAAGEDDEKKKQAEAAAAEAAAADKAKADKAKADAEEAERKKKEGEKKEGETKSDDPKGIAVDLELKTMLDSGKEVLTLDELKKFAPNSYNVIFECYKANDPEGNGISTGNYNVTETEKETFKITKA